MTIPTVAITFDYYPEAYSAAFPLMLNRGLVGTYFVDPDTVDKVGGPTRDNLTVLKMAGWTIGAYSGINMVDTFNSNRNTAMDRIAYLYSSMLAKGFRVRSLAPNQRAWDGRLRNVSAGMFDRVRVAADFVPQPLPVPDSLYIKNGGTPSLSSNDTAASVNQNVTDFLCQPSPCLWSIVIHKVGDTPDGYTVATPVFTALLDRLKCERDAGTLRIVGYDDI